MMKLHPLLNRPLPFRPSSSSSSPEAARDPRVAGLKGGDDRAARAQRHPGGGDSRQQQPAGRYRQTSDPQPSFQQNIRSEPLSPGPETEPRPPSPSGVWSLQSPESSALSRRTLQTPSELGSDRSGLLVWRERLLSGIGSAPGSSDSGKYLQPLFLMRRKLQNNNSYKGCVPFYAQFYLMFWFLLRFLR